MLIEALPSILPILEAPLREKAEAFLTKKGCEIRLSQDIVSASPWNSEPQGRLDRRDRNFHLDLRRKGSNFAGSLGLPTGERNRLRVDEEMKSPAYPFVYIVGDNLWFSHDDQTLPQVIETAHFTAETAAKNIIADIEGGERHTFRGNYHGFVISLGGRYCVSNAGGMKTSGSIAMAMKHMINLYYQYQIAGVNQVWEYVKHEFLDMKSGRSMIGSFASYKVRSHWVFSFVSGSDSCGLSKESIRSPKGGSIFRRARAGTEQDVLERDYPGRSQTAGGPVASAAGTVSAATSGAPAAASSAAATWTAKSLIDTTLPIISPDSGFAIWFRRTFMDGIFAYLPFPILQSMIVVMEIAIGLAIFGGLFTWWAAAASIAMCFVFTFTGMFIWSQAWFIFAAIVMLGGAGRGFGFRLLVGPILQEERGALRSSPADSYLYADDPAR